MLDLWIWSFPFSYLGHKPLCIQTINMCGPCQSSSNTWNLFQHYLTSSLNKKIFHFFYIFIFLFTFLSFTC